MSAGERLPLAEAVSLANEVIALLRPYCQRIEIAGSIRRRKLDVGDIELVCIPNMVETFDLFGKTGEEPMTAEIAQAIRSAGFALGKNGDRYKQFEMPRCKCDLFITDADRWGMIYTIRTGSAEFTHKLVTPRNQGGLMPSHLQAEDGRIKSRTSSVVIPTPEERDVFMALWLPWIDPEAR